MSAAGTRDRALGALVGLAAGDALGMPTQLLPRGTIVARHGPVLPGFVAAPEDHPIAAGMPAGAVTDDTEQALVLARVLVEGSGRVDAHLLAERLLAWEASMRARGSLDLLGPSTRRALAELVDGGDPAHTGRAGDTNGAAMRVTPVGIATPPDLDTLIDAVVSASAPTHHTGLALAGAAAVAAAVSAGVAGDGLGAALAAAVGAADVAGRRGRWVAGADVATRIAWAVDLVDGLPPERAVDAVFGLVGTSLATQESVPAAFALLVAADGDPWLTCRLAASVGGDCDTIAAMAGAVAGACAGAAAFPDDVLPTLERVNALDLAHVADDLLVLRARHGGVDG